MRDPHPSETLQRCVYFGEASIFAIGPSGSAPRRGCHWPSPAAPTDRSERLVPGLIPVTLRHTTGGMRSAAARPALAPARTGRRAARPAGCGRAGKAVFISVARAAPSEFVMWELIGRRQPSAPAFGLRQRPTSASLLARVAAGHSAFGRTSHTVYVIRHCAPHLRGRSGPSGRRDRRPPTLRVSRHRRAERTAGGAPDRLASYQHSLPNQPGRGQGGRGPSAPPPPGGQFPGSSSSTAPAAAGGRRQARRVHRALRYISSSGGGISSRW